MATEVILPALGMSQETGKILRWFKAEGEHVAQGDPLVEIETDKAAVEIEAPTAGVLAHVAAAAGDDVPVGQVIAHILAAGETLPRENMPQKEASELAHPSSFSAQAEVSVQTTAIASALASRIAAEHNLDLSQVKPVGRRIQKADVLAYLQSQDGATPAVSVTRLTMASPKARRLAREAGKDLANIQGSGPAGAILATDVLAAAAAKPVQTGLATARLQALPATHAANGSAEVSLGNIWRIMAERTTQSWTEVPHFYLMREVNASRLIAWREQIMKHSAIKVTYTDLLAKIVAASLRLHPRINVSWQAGKVTMKQEIHIGLAVAIEDGLVVPVIHQADTLSLAELAQQRTELVAKAQAGKLRPQDISDGTFTISNLGMYNVDAFNAIINQPQAAILAVGRIADRVTPMHGQPSVQPMMTLTLSCDHRAVDGARGAQFLDSIVTFVEEPLGMLV